MAAENLVSKKKASSPAWGYFGFKPATEDTPIDETSPVCRLCLKNVSAKSGNTSNLFSHLKNKHPRQYVELRGAAGPSAAGGSQLTIKESFETSQKYPKNSRRWEQLTNAVSYTIAKDMMPFTAVERPGFKRMLSAFDQRYELPGRKYFSQTAIPSLYNKTREKVESELQSVMFFSATTDLWSSETLHPYMSYTVHFITDSWEYRNLSLQTAFLPSDHTGDNLAEALTTALDSWNLKEEMQVCITTDSGANIVSATRKLGWQRLSCFGHNLNLAVTKSLQHDHRVTRSLGLARKIVSSFSNSWKRRRELKRVQTEKDLPQHSLISVSNTT